MNLNVMKWALIEFMDLYIMICSVAVLPMNRVQTFV